MHRNNSLVVLFICIYYATALSALQDPSLPPVDQTSCRFTNRVAVDVGFDGMGLDDEAERLSLALGKRLVMMGNHGSIQLQSRRHWLLIWLIISNEVVGLT